MRVFQSKNITIRFPKFVSILANILFGKGVKKLLILFVIIRTLISIINTIQTNILSNVSFKKTREKHSFYLILF